MSENQILPFERNRYYSGKLLTSFDFQAEQKYFNDKRKFVNRFVLGRGVVCGLSVLNLDDLSIMVESGVAVDGSGREIAVENSVVKKLSTIEGYEQLESSRAILFLAYQEEEVHPVYAVNRQEREGEYQFNRIREGYRFFLKEERKSGDIYELQTEFYSTAKFYSDEWYEASLVMPSTICCGRPVRIALSINKKRDGGEDLFMELDLQTPSLSSKDGEGRLHMESGLVHLKKGQSFTQSYWMWAGNEEREAVDFIAEGKDITVRFGEKDIHPENGVSLRGTIQDVSPEALVTREIGKISLEMRGLAAEDDAVPLARILLARNENSCFMEGVEEDVKKYIPLPAEESLRAEYASYYTLTGVKSWSDKETGREGAGEAQGIFSGRGLPYAECAAGVCEILLGAGAKRGMVRRSGEIVHGLGNGNVLVNVGLEYFAEDPALKTETRQTVQGAVELFEEEEKLPAPLVKLAVKILHDKGTFVVAAGLLEDTSASVVNVRWTAMRIADDGGRQGKESAGTCITAQQPTVVLKPEESHYFPVLFSGMEPCSLLYELTEPGSGEISPEGVYTAPYKEGIYEIKISCAGRPAVCTYAYAIVKKQVE